MALFTYLFYQSVKKSNGNKKQSSASKNKPKTPVDSSVTSLFSARKWWKLWTDQDLSLLVWNDELATERCWGALRKVELFEKNFPDGIVNNDQQRIVQTDISYIIKFSK